MFEELWTAELEADEAGLVARLTRMERVKSAAAADQARTAAALDTMRRTADEAAGVPAAKRGRGLGSEIALARHDSPRCRDVCGLRRTPWRM